jgi:hypothetical protein
MKHVLLALLIAVACTSITAQLPSYLPTDGLVGWWPFNGNANDESGNGNNGTVNGATLAEDRFGQVNSSFLFNGNSQNIACASIDNISSLTLSFWQKTNPNGGGAIITQNNPNNCINVSFDIQLGPTDGVMGISHNANNCNQPGVNLNTVSSANSDNLYNQWNHVLGIIDETGSTKIYINSQLMDSSIYNVNYSSCSTINTSLRFGGPWWNSDSQYYVGQLDDIAIYNRALTPEEITALYTGVPADNNSTANTSATLPGAISYQAVARDAQGAALNNASLQVQFTLLADSLTGAAEYVETHALTTNSLGLFTTAFGGGAAVSGTFAGINWTTGNKYLNVQIDTGSGWVDIGTQQLLSVPYSMHSATAGSIKNPGLPIYPDNAAAISGGLTPGDTYRTAGGDLKVVY